MPAPRSTSRRTVHIVSDGDTASTKIFGADGTELQGVVRFELSGDGGDSHLKLVLELMEVPVDVDARLGKTVLRCAVCGEDVKHNCGTMA